MEEGRSDKMKAAKGIAVKNKGFLVRWTYAIGSCQSVIDLRCYASLNEGGYNGKEDRRDKAVSKERKEGWWVRIRTEYVLWTMDTAR